jgi:hypothetical protein
LFVFLRQGFTCPGLLQTPGLKGSFYLSLQSSWDCRYILCPAQSSVFWSER